MDCAEIAHKGNSGVQVGERSRAIASGQLRGDNVPDGPLPTYFGAATIASLRAWALGGNRGLRQFDGAGVCPSGYEGRPSGPCTSVSNGKGWVECAVLGSTLFSKAVEAIPESGLPQSPTPGVSLIDRMETS